MDPQVKAALWKRVRAASAGGAMAVMAVMTPYFEGTRFIPYEDIVGVLTVCRGHTGKDIKLHHVYTPQECDALEKGDVGKTMRAVDKGIKVKLGLFTYVAIIDFAYNVGPQAFMGSTLRKRINAGEGAPACDEFMQWLRAGLLHPPGLRDRREFERELCIEGFTETKP